MKGTIHIVAATDENYWHFTAAMLLSLVSNHRSEERIVCHLITSGLTDDQKNKFVEFFHPKALTIDWLSIDPTAYKEFPIAEHLTHAAYYRVEIPQLLSLSITKVIYLDSDTLILDDISKLWHLDTVGHPIAAAENFYSFHKEFVGIPAESKFFNSGVMVIDLEYWRQHNASEKLKSIIMTQKEKMIYCDQEALNILFYDKCFFLPFKWNHCPEHEEIIQLFALHRLRPGLKEAMENPSLIHFLGARKPDKPDDFSFYADKCRSYFRKIPFVSEKVQPPSLRQRIKKFLYQMRRKFPIYRVKRLFLQLNPGYRRLYWPALPDWYW